MKSRSQSPIRLLIVEDDKKLSSSLLDHFHPTYTTTMTGDTEVALGHLFQPPGYDVTLVDLPHRDADGCNLLEQANRLAIETSFLLMLDPDGISARIQNSIPRIDDYIAKPFAMQELDARVESILCRQLAPESYGSHAYALGDLTINFASQTCFRDGDRIPLSSREFQILQYLVEQRGHVVSAEELRGTIWADDKEVMLRTVDQHVTNIQKKIEQTPDAPAYLHTVHETGYEFASADYV